MKRVVFIFTVLFSALLHGQNNPYIEWPFLRNVCEVDMNCARYKTNNVISVTDSAVYNNQLSVAQRSYDANGRLLTVCTWEPQAKERSYMTYETGKKDIV